MGRENYKSLALSNSHTVVRVFQTGLISILFHHMWQNLLKRWHAKTKKSAFGWDALCDQTELQGTDGYLIWTPCCKRKLVSRGHRGQIYLAISCVPRNYSRHLRSYKGYSSLLSVSSIIFWPFICIKLSLQLFDCMKIVENGLVSWSVAIT